MEWRPVQRDDEGLGPGAGVRRGQALVGSGWEAAPRLDVKEERCLECLLDFGLSS